MRLCTIEQRRFELLSTYTHTRRSRAFFSCQSCQVAIIITLDWWDSSRLFITRRQVNPQTENIPIFLPQVIILIIIQKHHETVYLEISIIFHICLVMAVNKEKISSRHYVKLILLFLSISCTLFFSFLSRQKKRIFAFDDRLKTEILNKNSKFNLLYKEEF